MKFVRNGLCRSVEVTPDMTEALGMPQGNTVILSGYACLYSENTVIIGEKD